MAIGASQQVLRALQANTTLPHLGHNASRLHTLAMAAAAASRGKEGHVGHKLTEEEREKHAGIVFLSFAVLVLCQAALYFWKQKSPVWYQRVTFSLLWAFPPLLCIQLGWWRFVIIWVIYSGFTGRRLLAASKRPLPPETSRDTYAYFYSVYQVTVLCGMLGYLSFILHIVSTVLGYQLSRYFIPIGVLLLFYGVYFGVLNRDLADVVADKLNSTIGFSSKAGLPKRNLEVDICALCGNILKSGHDRTAALQRTPVPIRGMNSQRGMYGGSGGMMSGAGRYGHGGYPGYDMDHDGIVADCAPPSLWEMISPLPDKDATVQLNCQHRFHELCVRGWAIVGKKDVCPYCAEHVDLRSTFVNPWETHSYFWANMLDMFRYLVVWNPLIFTGVQLLLRVTGVEHAHQALHHIT